jgi:hypothetical protein
MSSIYVFRVGPLTSKGESLYVPVSPGKALEVVDAASDAAGLRQIAAQAAGATLTCEPRLAQAGAALGFTAAEMPAKLHAMRAKMALEIALAPDIDAIRDLAVWDQFLGAAGVFWRGASRQWWPSDTPVDVEVTGPREQRFEGVLVREPAPGMVLFETAGDALRYLGNSADERAAMLETRDNLRVAFEPGPAYALETLDARYGLAAVPRPRRTKNGQVQSIDEDALIALAAALRGMGGVEEIDRPAYGRVDVKGTSWRGFVRPLAPSAASPQAS